MKPLLVCLCGPSASGKDTLLNKVECSFNYVEGQCSFHRLISDTTRPRRVNEIVGFDYNYISEEEFLDNIDNNKYLEYTHFRNWYYGTPNTSIKEDNIYAGVFNPEGIYNIYENYKDTYNILVYYVSCPFFVRLYRSVKRENKFNLEVIRRAIADARDFKKFRKSSIPYISLKRHYSNDLELKLLRIYLDLSEVLTISK